MGPTQQQDKTAIWKCAPDAIHGSGGTMLLTQHAEERHDDGELVQSTMAGGALRSQRKFMSPANAGAGALAVSVAFFVAILGAMG